MILKWILLGMLLLCNLVFLAALWVTQRKSIKGINALSIGNVFMLIMAVGNIALCACVALGVV